MEIVKFVAIYLRKSRGDEEKDLVKHENILEDLCENNDWKYVKYQEVGSGDKIAGRPQMQKLLVDIEEGIYDGVAVVDFDRLGRGDMGDQDKINKTFKQSETLIITPDKIYDLSNEDDQTYSEFKGFLARQELKMIKKRLVQGKKIGAKLGNWTNGTPPFPYEYDPSKKGLVINEEKYKVYRMMVDWALKGETVYQIAVKLNKMGISSPKNALWYSITIYRILKDETHLGKIISNKTKGSGHKYKEEDLKILPKEDWVVVNNCHEPVKTQQEHNQILQLFKSRKKIPKRAREGHYPLSGLVRCGICKKTMQFVRQQNGRISIKKCQYSDFYGNQCCNRGGDFNLIMDRLNEELKTYKEEMTSINIKESEIKKLKDYIKQINQQINQKEKSLEKIDEAFEQGVYEIEKYKERHAKIKKEIQEIEEERKIYQSQINDIEDISPKKKIGIIDNVLDLKFDGNNLPGKEINAAYKSIVDAIYWTREKDDITIEIIFK